MLLDDVCAASLIKWRSLTGAAHLPPLVVSILKHLRDHNQGDESNIEYKGGRAKLLPEEDKRHRAVYRQIADSEDKLRFFAARQVACRLVGSIGYLCEQCWIPRQDCICDKVSKGTLWPGLKLWLYMHPKDFMRKNNTGKLLWHCFGASAVELCVCGIEEQEEAMWSLLQKAGRDRVWCLFPEKSVQVHDIVIPRQHGEDTDHVDDDADGRQSRDAQLLHFVLMDGTWRNSKAMLTRMNLGANRAWGSGVQCVALNPSSFSAMHDLRPQPSTERTCTAAAASQLLKELAARAELAGAGLEEAAQTVDNAIKCLFDALAGRRTRVGKPVPRLARRN